MKTQKNLIVQVRVYKGKVNYNEKGELTSQAQLIKLRHGIKEWTLFLKSITQMGWSRVDVIKCLDGNTRIEKDGMINHPVIDTPDNIAVEIKEAMVGPKKQLTPEQQEIKDLKDQMAELLESKKGKSKGDGTKDGTSTNTSTSTKNDSDEKLNDTRKEYEEVFGKKPHHKKTLEKLTEEIKVELTSKTV